MGGWGAETLPWKYLLTLPTLFQSQRPRWREKIGHHEGEGGVGREICGD